MIRVVLFLLIVGALSFGVAWLADRPGDVMITWQGLRIETSLMVLGGAVLVLMAALALLWTLVSLALRSPTIVARMRRERRGVRAYEAISHGLIAVGSGDASAARLHSAAVNRIAAGEPLALLLAAQSAQLSGDRDAAESTFRTMASRADTKALGLHGLYVEAQRRNDLTSARAYAEEAARTAPALGWAGRAVQEFRCLAGDWAGALAHLERTKGTLSKDDYRRQRAVMLIARAHALEDTDREQPRRRRSKPPSSRQPWCRRRRPRAACWPKAANCAKPRALSPRRGVPIRIRIWRRAYADLRFGDAARDRLDRVEALVKEVPGHIEGALAVARAALDAREFEKARAALAPYLDGGDEAHCAADGRTRTRRAQRRGPGARMAGACAQRRVRSAMDGRRPRLRALAAGVAGSGRLDAFEWRVPLTGMVAAPVIEPLPPMAPLPHHEPMIAPAVPAPTESSQPQRRAAARAAVRAADSRPRRRQRLVIRPGAKFRQSAKSPRR